MMIQSWQKGSAITLVPNPKWYGATKSHLDKVVFQLVTDTSTEFQAFKSGQVKMIYPQPQIDVVNQIGAGIPGANSKYNADTGAVRGHLGEHGPRRAGRPGRAPGDRLLDRPQRDRQDAVRQARA